MCAEDLIIFHENRAGKRGKWELNMTTCSYGVSFSRDVPYPEVSTTSPNSSASRHLETIVNISHLTHNTIYFCIYKLFILPPSQSRQAFLYIFFMIVYSIWIVGGSKRVEVRGQPEVISSLLPPGGCQGSNIGPSFR